jgi:hypothetical protein
MLTDSPVTGSKPMNLLAAPINKASADASLPRRHEVGGLEDVGKGTPVFSSGDDHQVLQGSRSSSGSSVWLESPDGWTGLTRKASGIVGLGYHEAFCGNTLWEEKYPEAAKPQKKSPIQGSHENGRGSLGT